MADAKISALTALTQADLAPADDVIPIVDTGATATKKITLKEAVGGSINQLAQTWNATATTFTGLSLSVTDTASAAGSNLLELRGGAAGTTSVFSAGKDGTLRLGASSSLITPAFSVLYFGPGPFSNPTGGFGLFGAIGFGASLRLDNGVALAWNTAGPSSGADVGLWRDAANTLAQRNGTNAQTFRLYRTYTAADNFQRLAITSASATLSALSGASVTSSALIPAGAVVVGVTARVSTLIEGASGFQIGTVADPDRWGDITGTAVGTTSDNANWTSGTIECFTAATDVVVTAKTSNFTAGAILVTIHYLAGQAD